MLLLAVSIFLRAMAGVMGQEYVVRRLGGRENPFLVPALGIKCTTPEMRIVNEVVEECLEMALGEELGEVQGLGSDSVDGCQVVEACLLCTNLRAACMDDRSLREFKDSMFDVYLMLGLGLEVCGVTQEYLQSGRSMQLVLESVCDPWQIFEVDWNYRYCVSTITRAAITGARGGEDSFVLEGDMEALIEDMEDTEFADLVAQYKGKRLSFCDFSQLLLACGEQLHPCYHDNVMEVEVLKFLTSLYWLGEYEQPLGSWALLADQVGVEEVMELAEHQQGEHCRFSQQGRGEL